LVFVIEIVYVVVAPTVIGLTGAVSVFVKTLGVRVSAVPVIVP
jgi:hypothetical protein